MRTSDRVVARCIRTTRLLHERLEPRALLTGDVTNDAIWMQIPAASVEPVATFAIDPSTPSDVVASAAATQTTIPSAGLLLRYETVGTNPYAATSGRVTTWADQAGAADNAIGTTGPSVISKGTPAGRPSLRFDGGSRLDINTLTALNGKQTLTWFIVFKQGNTAPGVLMRTNVAAGTKYWGTYNQSGLISHARSSTNVQTGPLAAFPERNNWHISSAAWNGTAAAVNGIAATTVAGWIDGDGLGAGTATGANGSPGNHVTTTIGMNPDGTLPFVGEIAAVIVYDTCLTATDRQTVERYLRDTYFKVSDNTALLPFLGAAASSSQQLWTGSGGRTIVTAKDGSLVAVRDDQMRRSVDGGATWAATQIIHSTALGKEGKCVVDETTGDILYTCPMDATQYRSRDNGVSWSREAITVAANSLGHKPDGIQANQPGVTIMQGPHAGRLLIPARVMPGGNVVSARADHYNTSIYSDDGGKTWQTSEPFPDLGTGEAALAELSNGNILYSSREHMTKDFRHFAWSYDSGETYTGSFVSPVLPDGPRGSSYGCMGGLVRLPVPGADVLIYSNLDTDAGVMPSQPGGSTTVGRERITVWASFDGGQTWPVKRLVYDGPSGYSNLAVGRAGTASAGKIFLDYEGGPGGQDSTVRLASFNLAWLLDGRNIDTFFNPTGSDIASSATWVGQLGSSSWGASNNWGGTLPVFDSTLDVSFSGPGAGNLTNALGGADRTIRSLAFNADTDSAVNIYLADTTANGVGKRLMFAANPGSVVTHTVAAGATGNIQIGFGEVGEVELASPVVVNHAGSGAFGFDAPIRGSSGNSLTVNSTGQGSVFLSGVSDFAGGVVLNSGLLRVGHDAGLGTGTLRINGGSLAIATSTARTIPNPVVVGGNFTLGSIRPAPTIDGTVSLGGATRTITVDVSSTISGSVSNGAIVKAGTGTLTLSGANTFTGGLTLGSGTLAMGSAGAIGPSGTIVFNGGALGFTAANTVAPSSRFSQAANQAYRFDTGGQTITIGSSLTSAGGSLTKEGAGTLTLSAANTISGNTSINAGTLALAASGSVASSRLVTVSSGAALDVTAKTGGYTVPATQTIAGSGTVVGSLVVSSAATVSPGISIGTLRVSQNATFGSAGNFNLQIADAAAGPGTGWDTVTVGGALTLSATAANPFRINLGSLSGANPGINGIAAGFDPTRNYSWRIVTATGGITGFAANEFVVSTAAANGTGGFLNGLAGGAFSVAQSGNDLNLVFTAAPPPLITIAVPSGTQTQGQAGYPTLTGTVPIVKAGLGVLVVDQANTLSGSMTVQEGRLHLAHGSALAASRLVPLAGGTVTIAPALQTAVGGLAANVEGIVDVGSGMLTIAAGLSSGDLVTALAAGRGDGSWNGTSGILSSAASVALAASIPRTIGWLDNGDGSMTCAFAAPGDTNLDWQVDILDAANFLAGAAFDTGLPAAWNQGDFGGDGVVDILDAADFLSTSLFDVGPYNGSSLAAAIASSTAATIPPALQEAAVKELAFVPVTGFQASLANVRGRMHSTTATESSATAAKPPKITFSGTFESRSAPNPQSATPPQEMLARFMNPYAVARSLGRTTWQRMGMLLQSKKPQPSP